MFGDAPEWFGVVLWLSPSRDNMVVTLASPYLEVALSGCLLFLQLFLEGGYEKIFFSSGPQLCIMSLCVTSPLIGFEIIITFNEQ